MISLVQTNNVELGSTVHQIQVNERKRIAQELHDEIGQYLTAIHLDASAIIAAAEINSAHDIAADIDLATLQVMDRVKTILHRLRPVNESNISFENAMQELISSWKARNSDVMVSLDIRGDISNFDESVSKTIFRLIQESLTNVSRHADAQNVIIFLSRTKNKVSLSVKDDGKGFNKKLKPNSFGLMGMQERVVELNGKFEIVTYPDFGVSISVSIPCL